MQILPDPQDKAPRVFPVGVAGGNVLVRFAGNQDHSDYFFSISCGFQPEGRVDTKWQEKNPSGKKRQPPRKLPFYMMVMTL
jgi:hypothetical protein